MPAGEDLGHVLQVRAAVLANYVPLAQSVGLNGAEMLQEFGIDPRLLAHPESRIPATAVSRLISESARRSGCETFGLRLAERRRFSSLGPLSLLLRHESSFRAVLEQLIAHQRLITDIIDLRLEENGDETRIDVELAPDIASRQCVQLVMALVYRFLGGAMFGGWRPAEVHFRYRAPADTTLYQKMFRAPLRFNATFNGFLLPTASLDRRNAYGDPGLVEHARHYVDLLARALPVPSLVDQVRSSIKRLLPTGAPTLARVAAELAIHPRALQRKLSAADLRFTDLVESIRQDLARDLLADTDLPVTEVALLVGYASPASFSRWFSGTAGRPPREWRLQNRTGAGA
jgi:AraC-like DNA-binding protein